MSSAPDSLSKDVATIASDLAQIRRQLSRKLAAQAATSPLDLTPKQLRLLQVLVETEEATGAGLSISELGRRLGIGHSSASALVSRTERRGLLERHSHPGHKLAVQVRVKPTVMQWLSHDPQTARLEPLRLALADATPDERRAIIEGLAVLTRLLAAS